MPHQCAECGEQYPDGSDEILSGCSGCGGNKFQFVPAEQPEPEEEEEVEPVSAGRDSQPAMSAGMASQEDDAQQDARSSMVSTDELPVNAGEDDSEETGEQDAIEEEPASVDSVREALNQQFESIRILSPGEYELDLMKLYEREDHVISLYDDGKYAIHINEDE